MFAGSISNVDLGVVVKDLAGDIAVPIPPAVQSVLDQISISGTGAFSLPASPLNTALLDRDAKGIAAAFAAATPPVTVPASLDKLFISKGSTDGHWFVTALTDPVPAHYEPPAAGQHVLGRERRAALLRPAEDAARRLEFDAGMSLNGTLSVLGLTATAEVVIIESTGISATASLSKIAFPNQNVFVVHSADGTTGPLFSVSTWTDSSQTDPNLRPPHVVITGKVSLLGLAGESVYCDLQEDGFHFTLTGGGSGATVAVHAVLTSSSGLAASGSATVAIDQTVDLGSVAGQDLGSVPLDATAPARWRSRPRRPARRKLQRLVLLRAAGIHDPDRAARRDDRGAREHRDDGREHRDRGGKSFLLGDVNRWLNWVNSNVIAGFANAPAKVGAVLSDAYDQTPDEIASLTHSALGYGADAAAQALAGAGVAANDAANALSAAGYQAGDIASAIANAFKGIHADVNIGHADTPQGPHADSQVPPHGRFRTACRRGRGHTDSHQDAWGVGPHEDFGNPHVDSAPHADTPAGPHADTNVPPHGDIPTHIDT